MSKLNRILNGANPRLTLHQRELYQQIKPGSNRNRLIIEIKCFAVSCAIILLLFLVELVGIQTSLVLWVPLFLFQVLLILIVLVEMWLYYRKLPYYVVERLRRDSIMPGACPKCGYDLSHNVGNTCPECGYWLDTPVSD